MSAPDTIRQRKKEPSPSADDPKNENENKNETEKAKPSLAALAKAEDNAFSWVDVARTLVFLLLASSALSYFVTRQSLTWNVKRPRWTRVETIRSWMAGPLQLTDAELLAYDGSDPTKPLYLAINGSIYDVTLGARHYGPGGSYHHFAGRDASRAFVTNCFAEDGVPDLRGVEAMFLPLDDPETDALYGKGELKALREQEQRQARKTVHEKLKHWVDFFESGKYPKVGRVKREAGWREKGPVRELCKRAQAGRVKRKGPEGKEKEKEKEKEKV